MAGVRGRVLVLKMGAGDRDEGVVLKLGVMLGVD